ncbi:LrgB family protein [Enterococcus songbeiensis]
MFSELTQSPLFGLALTITTYSLMEVLFRIVRIPFINPLIATIFIIIFFLKITRISYEEYDIGANFLTMMITPATISLALPLYRHLAILKQNILVVLFATLAGILTNCVLSISLGHLFSLNDGMILSLLPKTVTAALAIDLSNQMGGISAVTLAIVVSTGILGALLSSQVFKIFRINSPVARGIALGSTSHAIGTGRAIELGEVEGILSGLCICINGIVTVLLLPTMYSLIERMF